MHLIVTHDNADFDAVASLLGASKLYAGAVAMIPHRLNRNVRDFLHLYWEAFDFITQQELPKSGSKRDGVAPIRKLTMVDTQQAPSLPGVSTETLLQVIDHHALDVDLPANAVTTIQPVGATATLLVEELQRQHIELTPKEATLLLLGIYEDSGSLLYANTSSRDVRAAAWLMEHQASLEVVRQFLHYPLSDDQRTLFQRLTESLEMREFEGHSILLCQAHMGKYVEEVSSLAHRLRALYEPDALFLLVAMDDHTQLVARSASDAIDVGTIAAELGGGGHARAAAAVIRHTDLHQIHGQIMSLLHLYVAPVATVGRIMSFGVHTLAPNDTVAKAAEVMARYGHEGFPVVDSGRIVGVLTRREIDKAMHHGFGGAPIRQVMRQGEYYVTPQDSVETLQDLMTAQGLGQVPVMDDDEIVGIVTRTDLINLWSEVPRRSRSDEIAARLAEVIPPALLHLLQEAGRIAADQEASLFVVGGFVRDLLHLPNMGRVPYPDIDLVVEGDAITLALQLAHIYGGEVRSHQRFGTAKWLIGQGTAGWEEQSAADDLPRNHLPESLDFVTARMEYYEHPSALPQVERSSIKQDLHRRDFTINTMAIDLTPERYGELLDFYGGEADLRQGLVRVLHSLSFVEDPTRMLRAVRLEQRLGFRLELRTAELLHTALDLLDRVSGERIYHELHLILNEPEPERALRRLAELGILRQIQAELYVDKWITEHMRTLRSGLNDTPWSGQTIRDVHYLGLMTCRLPSTALDAVVDRLRIRAADAAVLHAVKMLQQRHMPHLQQPLAPSHIFLRLNGMPSAALLIGWLVADDEVVRAQIAQFQRELRGMETILDGHYLRRELGIPPGPVYRRILDDLLAARLDGQVVTDADERAWVDGWLQEHAGDRHNVP